MTPDEETWGEIVRDANTLSESISEDEMLATDIASVLNKHCRENISNTPDFILAEYLVSQLIAFERASLAREKWYGKSLEIKFDPIEDMKGVTE